MSWRLAIGAVCLLLLSGGGASADDGLRRRTGELFAPIPDRAPGLQPGATTEARIELGRMLFFDPRLSASHLISCNTCHNLGLAGVDLQETSIGHGWQKGPRNAPTVLNAVFNIAQFWDGRAKDLAEQAKGPVQASIEMNNSREGLLATVQSLQGYVDRFRRAFPGAGDPVTFDNVAAAIEDFEATLLTPNARFDRYLKGDDGALDEVERSGLRLFLDKGCGSCHGGVNLGGLGYYPFGVVEKPGDELLPPGDQGRFQVTNTASDRYVFRSPGLRNVALTSPYFHSGRVWTLGEAVAIMGSAQLGIELTRDERRHIVSFLETLTGDQPAVPYPVLPPNTAATPRPALK